MKNVSLSLKKLDFIAQIRPTYSLTFLSYKSLC